MYKNEFLGRHIGPDANETAKMLEILGVNSVDELIRQVVPQGIRNNQPLNIEKGLTEQQYLKHIWEVAQKTKYTTIISDRVIMVPLPPPRFYAIFLKTRDGIRPIRLTRPRLHREGWKPF